MKYDKYSGFNSKDGITGNLDYEYDNSFVEKILDYSDFEDKLDNKSKLQKTNRFWCSALVGYIYTQSGILKKETDCSILVPNDFSLDGES
tara:strand:- start:1228 stop:1497 length:270 start_codon:yes stop_codon:yes gene_type:complete